MTINFNFIGTPVVKTGDGFLIGGKTPNDVVKIFLYLKDTYFSPSWNYNNGITLPYFIPNMKKADT